ncbi:MAG TPA: PKD domain-containing protein [Blastocatellia bacterium]|nr:PKD domain-containing protein [Blastocatellia bacterium]
MKARQGLMLNSICRTFLFMLSLVMLTIGLHHSQAQGNRPEQTRWGMRGQTAINQLGARLPELAARYSLAPEKLRSIFQTDSNLWLDNEDRLMFLDEFVPQGGSTSTSSTSVTVQGPLPYDQTFSLHSLPGSPRAIYLDFDGHTTTGTSWNNSYGTTITSAPFDLDGVPSSWSTTELDRIQYIWQRVAEDFLPFGVDVTTQDPGVEGLRKTSSTDEYYGQRVVISPTNWYNTGAGGVAYIGAFNWNTDTPCFVFTAQLGNGHEKYTAEAVSHEAGHTLGLYHDGKTDGTSYYEGHANWAPIMGVGYYREITQWSKGEYALANNTQDDLAVITSGYGVAYRADDHGGSISSATPLTVTNAINVNGKGIIERTTDNDYFSFLTGAGTITFTITPGPRSPNLDIRADLLNSSGALIASSNLSTLSTSISLNVPAGTYYLAIDGIGTGDPSAGYSDYASLGEFNITGVIIDPGALQPPTAKASANITSGNAPLAVNFSSAGSTDPDGLITNYSWNFGNGATSTSATPSYTYTSKGTYTTVLTVTDNDGLTSSSSVVITVLSPPAAPNTLNASAISSNQINLTWLDGSSDESGFKIDRSTDNATWTQIATVGANITSFSNTGLNPSTSYYYRVRAYNGDGNSAYTNTATATTLAAINLHIGDLDRATTAGSAGKWNGIVTVNVHNLTHAPVAGVLVSGIWGNGGSGTGSCTTDANGTCNITLSNIRKTITSVSFTVSNASKSGYVYVTSGNHDPDGESNGTTITIVK